MPIRTLVPALSVALLPFTALALSPTASGSPSTTDQTPRAAGASWSTSYTEAFESGTQQWTANARTAVTTVARGRGTGHAARLRIAGGTQDGTQQRGLTRIRHRSLVPSGSRYAVSAWLRSPKGRLHARLVVREIEAGTGTVLSRTKDRVTVSGAWRRASVTVKPHSASTILSVSIGGTQARAKRLLVDDVLVKAKTTPATPTTAQPKPTSDVAGVLSNGCAYDTRGLPACGAYMGAAHGANTEPSALEAQTGSRLGVRRTYYQASQVSSAVNTAKADIAAGRLPWISFKLPYTWEEMAAGSGDAWAKDIATKLNALNGPVWLAFHHEPEKDGNIIAWRTMQERLGPIVRQTADNVAFTVIVTGWNQLYGPTEYRFANLWPKTKVDVAGFDIYNFYLSTLGGADKPDAIKTDYFDKLKVWAAQNDTVWALAETGQTDEAFAVDPDWITQTHQELEQTGGVAMAYFNTTLNSAGSSWLMSTPAKLTAFAAALKPAPKLPVQ